MPASTRFRLFLASFLMLYFELVLIRWIPGQVRVIGYFTNFTLIACFFGMGLGMMLVRSHLQLERWATAGILATVLTAIAMSQLHIYTHGGVHLYLEYETVASFAVPMIVIVGLLYLLLAATMVPFGQAIGRALAGSAPLRDYAINLAGSLAGIAVFYIYSSFALPAWSWFLLATPLLVMFARNTLGDRLATAVAGVVCALLVGWVDRDTIWSPYQKIQVGPLVGIDEATGNLFPRLVPIATFSKIPQDVGFILRANDDFYQHPLNLSDETLARVPALQSWRTNYDFPYKLHPNPDRVLIVGGGTGNDAASALRNGARQVDVVEIDPTIVEIGRASHPERPYDDPRVTVHVDDARHFLHTAKPGYDVIVFALLDSKRLLSTMSSLRLDSYVYTVESFSEARALLDPTDGIQVTTFSVGRQWMVDRFQETLKVAYDRYPVIVTELVWPNGRKVSPFGLVAVSGPGASSVAGKTPEASPPGTEILTDDWPYTYAQDRTIPFEYLTALALVIILSMMVIRGLSGHTRSIDLHFFALGAGFLLLETRNVTTLALTFGSTWYVNSIVFASILVMALLSTAFTARTGGLPERIAYLGLFLAIALNAVFPFHSIVGSSLAVRILVVGTVTALPLFFSGMVFARSFASTDDPARALGSNVLGGVVGGIAEYLSMVFGLQFLLVLVALFYGLSMVARKQRIAAPA